MSSTLFDLKLAASVLFFRTNANRTSPSHSWKLIGGGGFFGTMRTTDDSTLGGGRKLFLPTFITWSTRANSWVLTDSRQYSVSPGLAMSRWANSRWNMRTAHRKKGRCSSSLNTKGDEIWYGMLATQTSKKGKSAASTSPTITPSLCCTGVPITRFWSSATIRGSTSHATTFLALSSSLTVMLPVPGPISSTVSVERSPDFSMIPSTTSGFLRMCCPKSLLKMMPCMAPPPPDRLSFASPIRPSRRIFGMAPTATRRRSPRRTVTQCTAGEALAARVASISCPHTVVRAHRCEGVLPLRKAVVPMPSEAQQVECRLTGASHTAWRSRGRG
mmetsp:Transcript_8529/g.21938  ORF Transcript_8529/g.21938 Transcript_8529/m.21938 type:complete len:330 (+) Transcript_8529:1336-2325(+)